MNVQQMPVTEGRPNIGWKNTTLREMLEENERLMRETGHYAGVTELSLRDSDPIFYEKVASRLRGAMVGARETALNISASPIVREIGELCFSLYTPEGDSISLSTGIMAHVHTMSEAIKYMIRADYEETLQINQGDIFVNNDPQLGDVHNADVQNFLPIFWEGELLGWACGVTHEIDVGAPQPVSMPVGTTSRFEDGWIVSCEKNGTNDTLHQDYLARCKTRTRMPFYWILDERCRIAGCQLIRESVLRLIEEIGVDTYKTFIRETIEDTRQACLHNVRTTCVPGTYRFPSFIDVASSINRGRVPDHAARDMMMHSPMEVVVEPGGRLDISLDGANKWGPHAYNCTPSGLQGGLWVTLCQMLIPNDKVNDGAYLATTFDTPYGTWANPDNPYCSNTLSWVFLIPCFTGLAKAASQAFAARGFLEEVLCGYPFTGNTTQGGGPNHYGAEDAGWSNFEQSSCGISAGYVKDGVDCGAAVWNPEGDMGDVEAWELIEPLLYLGRRLRPNSAGAGKYRGGSGFEAVRMIHGTALQQMLNVSNGFTFHGGGMFGGYPGATSCRHVVSDTDLPERFAKRLPYPVRDADPENSQVDAHVEGNVLRDQNMWHVPDTYREYDIYVSYICGGHGSGDVLERDVEAVVEDVNGEHMLPRYADPVYGVVLEQDESGRYAADDSATAKRRDEIRKQRLDRAVSVDDWMNSQRTRVERMEFSSQVRDMYKESFTLSEKFSREYRRFWNLDADWQPFGE